MIDRNIGAPERAVRLVLALLIVGWVVTGRELGALQGAALLAAFALLWNSIFARCYLWKWLGLSTCGGDCERRDDTGGAQT